MARRGRKGWQEKDGEPRKEMTARKGWRGEERKDGEERTARKRWRGKEALSYREVRWLG